MTEQIDPHLAMVFSFYAGVKRKGPGSEASTLKALSLLNHMAPNPQIVEFGCGTGTASIPLAQSQPCRVTAVDIHQPFLDELNSIAIQKGLQERITTVCADMGNPPFPNRTFDLIWSEAAIYNIGFERGLRLWKPLLRSSGYIVISEVVWLTSGPPHKAKEFWDSEYPAMTTLDDNLHMLENSGFDPVGHFILPSTDWQNYYGPLQEHVTEFRSHNSANAAAQTFADSVQQEIDLWNEFGESYGYAFFLGKTV